MATDGSRAVGLENDGQSEVVAVAVYLQIWRSAFTQVPSLFAGCPHVCLNLQDKGYGDSLHVRLENN